jgi:hypothetical protein
MPGQWRPVTGEPPRARQLNRKMLSGDGTNALWCGWVSMPRSLEREPDGVAVALAIHLSVYCAVAACVALVMYYLMDAAAQPGDGRAQVFGNHAKLLGVAALRARSRQARCQARGGAGNDRRSVAAISRSEARNEESQSPEHEPESKPPGASTTTTSRHDALRAAAVLRRLPADVLMFACVGGARSAAGRDYSKMFVCGRSTRVSTPSTAVDKLDNRTRTQRGF